MSDAYVIIADGITAGIIVRQRRGVRFYASAREVRSLDGLEFRKPQDAERAVRRLLAEAA
jgi:hypothetical protein